MVREEMYKEIQSYKQKGYSIRGCGRELNLDRKTVKRYWKMTAEEYVHYLADCKRRTKILDPYREEIAVEVQTHPSITSAIVYDHLKERHSDFKPSYGSVRLYVRVMREELGIPTPRKIRQYMEVEEQPAGYQAQVDMGQMVMSDPYGKKLKIYIFAMVMSLSRKKYVYFQDHPYNGQEFIEAHDRAFKYYGGRPEEIVYDQDRVMSVSENAGDLILTETFDTYRRYAGYKLRLCRGHDPQSKGKIESVVKYVKGNFLPCRVYHGISALNSEGLSWLDRTANAKVHETTKMIPDIAFVEEAKHLRPVPSLGTITKTIPREAIVRKTNVVHYKQNRYEVPKGTYEPGRIARIEPDEFAQRVCFYDTKTDELLATHPIETGKGRLVKLAKNADRFTDSNYKPMKEKLLPLISDLATCVSYMDRLIEKYPRYARDQLRILYECVRKHTTKELEEALEYCFSKDLISANDLRDVLVYFRQEEVKVTPKPISLPPKYQVISPKIRNISAYTKKGGQGQ